MKNNKGITLSSLVVYIAVVFVVLAILMRLTMYFSKNISNSADTRFESEFNKINLYLLDESKTTGNKITQISSKEVTFSSGNKYTFNEAEKVIYLNDKIKICENVSGVAFSKTIAENGKDIVVLRIVIGKTAKTAKYVMSKETGKEVVNAEDYVW